MVPAVRKNLVLFLLGKFVAAMGSSVYGFAVGLYILSQTGSAVSFSITLLLSALPHVLLSPVAGTLSDRWNRKRIIIFSDFGCAVWLTVIWFVFSFASQEIWVLYAAAGLLNVLNTFYSSAVTSAIPNMVGAEHIQKAMSINQAVISLSAILGPVLGGVLFGVLPFSIFMMVNIFTFVISGTAGIFIQYNLFAEKKEAAKKEAAKKEATKQSAAGKEADGNKTSLMSDLKLGVAYVKKQPFLLQLIFTAVMLNFWFAIFPVAMPYLVLTVRRMASYQLGMIEGAFSIGMMVMSLILTVRSEVKRKGIAVVGGIFALAVLLACIGLPSLHVMLGISNRIIFLYLILIVLMLAAAIMMINTPIMVLIQKNTQDEYRGRVLSLIETGASAMTPLGYILFGIFLEKLPVWLLLGICGAGIAALMIFQLSRNFLSVLHQAAGENKTLSMPESAHESVNG